jgi:hypothetical protein
MLIKDWKKSYKYLTVQLALGLVALSELYNYLPILQEHLPHNYVAIISILIVVARVINQTRKEAKVSLDK